MRETVVVGILWSHIPPAAWVEKFRFNTQARVVRMELEVAGEGRRAGEAGTTRRGNGVNARWPHPTRRR